VILIRDDHDDIDAAIAIYHEDQHFNGISSEPKAFTAEAILATKCGWYTYTKSPNLEQFFTRDKNGLVTAVNAAAIEAAITQPITQTYQKLLPGGTDPYRDQLLLKDPTTIRIGDVFTNVQIAK